MLKYRKYLDNLSYSSYSSHELEETKEADLSVSLMMEKLSINLDNNYFNFNSKEKSLRKESNMSSSLSFEQIDSEKEFSEKKLFVLLDEESKNEKFISIDEWKNILNSTLKIERQKIIFNLIYGIPNGFRGKIWQFLSKSENVSINHEKHFFNNLLNVKNEEIELVINKDIERTYFIINEEINDKYCNKLSDRKNNILKEKKKMLFDVLKAYSVYDPQVGYCQGTNFIVMMILSNVKSSDEAFWIFVQIMHDKNWRKMFINNTPKLIKVLDKLVNNIKIRLRDLYDHFEKENFIENIPGVFTHFFTTIFSYNIPIEYSNRIMDLFWVYEEKIIIDCLIHLLKIKKRNLIEMSCEELTLFIKNDLVNSCINQTSVEKCLPMHNYLLEEKEIIIN